MNYLSFDESLSMALHGDLSSVALGQVLDYQGGRFELDLKRII